MDSRRSTPPPAAAPPETRPTLFIAHAQELLLAGLVAIASDHDLRVSGVAATADVAVTRIRELDPGVAIIDGGVYAATQGPRLETVAEINRLERDGAAMVGMTAMPEAILAREIGLAYAAIAVVANHAAGRGRSTEMISMPDVAGILDDGMSRVRRIIEQMAGANGN